MYIKAGLHDALEREVQVRFLCTAFIMTEFMYYNINVQVRVPINPDGTLGQPQVYKKYTTEMKGTAEKYVKKKDPVRKKAVAKKKANELFKMTVNKEEDL